ncbi:peroxiredoxin family protein [Winogradskyella marincola]|uniref:TlpA disulfide reductase family protein n=1 Tax=Winogradskyella marincola TaxID=3037795 RepID=A0ABT6G513_9FLAO|nr:TlpA disulfide reductase family protein [Winogradskyella sp. YYF002]MDG4717148.1 TlpA disulfide reductase family protein [Winogradskyella sp. YYF002]
MRYIFGLLVISLLFSCKDDKKNNTLRDNKLETGSYRAWISIQDNEEIPFVFEVESDKKLNIYNAEETIVVDEIEYKNDSVYINLPVFEDYLVAKINQDNNLNGFYISPDRNRKVPFEATFKNAIRFGTGTGAAYNIEGVWETVFSKGVEEDEYIAKGVFKQYDNGKITGTFRTTTGDYRYLEGVLDGTRLKLSTFDGAHAFYFTATVTDSTMNGYFYSGNHWKEPFEAKRNKDYELPSANELTYLKEGYDSLDFVFSNTSDELVGLKDDRFKDKVVVVQIMGTWCPNCLDESKYYADFYKKNKDKGIEFIALAFEYAKDKETAFSRIDRLQSKIGIDYPVLLAQYGGADKAKAQEKLPMLNHVLSYPTSIFIDKKGKVRKIHTGFNGPATGEKYIEFKKEFESFVNVLLAE